MIKRSFSEQTLHNILPNRNLALDARWESRALFMHYSQARSVRAKFRGKRGIRANIGCGGNPVAGWENLDLQNKEGVSCWDLRRGMPFEDDSVSVIFSEHVFEHLDRPRSTRPFLAECLRCLEPGGVLRLVVPDAGLYLKAYTANDWDTLARIRPLERRGDAYFDPWLQETYHTPLELVNAVFRQRSEHKYAYDAATLTMDMKAAGFSTALHQQFGQSHVAGAAIDSPLRELESLYVEGVK